MKSTSTTAALVLIAVFCLAGGYPTCKCPNAGEDMYQVLMKMLRVRRVEMVTNALPATRIEDWSGYGPFLYRKFPETNYVTNFIIGTATKDLFRAEAIP